MPIDDETRTHEGLHERPHYLFAGNNLSDRQSKWPWDIEGGRVLVTNRGGNSKDEDKLCADH